MNIVKQFTLSALILSGSMLLFSCEDEGQVPDPINVNFANVEAGISSVSPSANITVVFSRATDESGSLTLMASQGSLAYGDDSDFYTNPSMTGSQLVVEYAQGISEISFTVSSGPALNITEDLEATFSLIEVGDNLALGNNSSVTVTFSENFVARSGALTLDAGGSEFPNQSFWDISKGIQTSVDKYSWDIGFSTGSENRLILNSAAYVMARQIDKSDLTAVTAQDTVGFAAVMSIPNFDPSTGASAWVDDHTGDLTATAFGDIASEVADAKVFIIKRDGEGRNWKKVKVYASADGYTIQYADIDAATASSANISKDELYNFEYFDLDNGEVAVAPAKDSWDISYGSYTIQFPFGTSTIPYGFSDYIILNRAGTAAAMVLIETESYEAFGLSDASDLQYAMAVNSIGSDWRAGGGPSQDPSVYEDRFFVIKDTQGNYYKVAFLSLTNESGERGYVDLKFELLQ